MISSNKVYLGNCMDLMADWISRKGNWFKFQLCITDPPYAVDYQDFSKELEKIGKASKKLVERDKHYVTFSSRKNQINRDKNYVDFIDFDYQKFCQYLYLLMDLDSHIYIWCGEKQVPIWIKEMQDAQFKFNQILVWAKNSSTFDMSRGMKYMYKHELCLFFRKGTKKLNKYDQTVFNYNTELNMAHPTIKPLKMIMRLVENSSSEGDLVFDPFLGSGTTAVASKVLKREYVGIEISEYFYKLSLKRISNETADRQVRLI